MMWDNTRNQSVIRNDSAESQVHAFNDMALRGSDNVLHDFHNKRKEESQMLRITDPEVKKRFLDYRTRLGAAVCLVAAVVAFSLVNFTVSADKGKSSSTSVPD